MVEQERAGEHLNRWGLDKCTGPDVVHPWVMKELAVVIVRPL